MLHCIFCKSLKKKPYSINVFFTIKLLVKSASHLSVCTLHCHLHTRRMISGHLQHTYVWHSVHQGGPRSLPHLLDREQRLQQPRRQQRQAHERHPVQPARGLRPLQAHAAVMVAQGFSQGPQHREQPLFLQTFKHKTGKKKSVTKNTWKMLSLNKQKPKCNYSNQ